MSVAADNMIPVNSSQIAAIGYDAEAQKLQIEFNNGWVYVYDQVAADVFESMKQAPSVGQFFYRNIKGRYSYYRVQ